MFREVCKRMKIESGSCNVCSAPCSSCMHYNQSEQVVDSKSDNGFSSITCFRGEEAESSAVINLDGLSVRKSRNCDDMQNVTSETSNLLSSCSSRDSYLENADSKTPIRTAEASYDVEMPQILSSREFGEERTLKRKFHHGHDHESSKQHKLTSGHGEEQRGLECHGDNILYAFEVGDANAAVSEHIVNIEKIITSFELKSSAFSNSKIVKSCEEIRAATDCEKAIGNGGKVGHLNDLDRNGVLLDAKNGQRSYTQTQPQDEWENSDPDAVLDVKVCDICGDAGREDFLAICSKCSDGAEHIYCMKKMLLKVPEGDWLCEECKIKEAENQITRECEAISEKLNSGCLIDIRQRALTALVSKKLPKLNSDSTDLLGPAKGLQKSQFLTQRQVDLSEVGIASLQIASPRNKTIVPSQFSISNKETGKAKTAYMPTSSDELSAKDSDAFSRSKLLLNSRSLDQPHPHSPRGIFSRSTSSFNRSNSSPKVKTLVESVPHRQNTTRESSTSCSRKEDLVKSLIKTTSFKNIASGRPNSESAFKSPFYLPSHEDLKGQKEVKERTVERKNFSAMQSSFLKPSSVATSNHLFKTDAKCAHSDKKLGDNSEADVSGSIKGYANSIGLKEGKKHASYSFKSVGLINENSNAEHLKGFKPINNESDKKDDNSKDSPSSTCSRLSSIKKIYCERCSETGHEIQHCTADKLEKMSNKPTAEGNPIEAVKTINKWREIVDSAMSKCGVLKNRFSVVQSRNGKYGKEMPSDPVKVSNLSEKPFTERLQGQASNSASMLRGSAIPKLESIWQGGFNVLTSGNISETFDGIQAHLSTCTSHRVSEAAVNLPESVQFEEASHFSSWPSLFQNICPQEKNIALFFFPRDAESYDRSYKRLMDRMLKNDLILRGNIDGIELFIFTSNKLPVNSQRWNKMHYLWGMFRAKRSSNKKENDLTFQKKLTSDCANKTVDEPIFFPSHGEACNLRRASSVTLASPNCSQDDEFSSIEGTFRYRECSASNLAIEIEKRRRSEDDSLNNDSCSYGKRLKSEKPNITPEMKINDETEPKNYSCAPEYFGADPPPKAFADNQLATPENPKTTERRFFPIDLFPVQKSKSDIIVDTSESRTPDLNLVLGDKGKLIEKPLASPLPCTSALAKLMELSPLGQYEDDGLSASLSLSLGFSAAEEIAVKSSINKEKTSVSWI